MVNKPDTILEIEKLLKAQINDFEIGADEAITCITLEKIKFTDKSLNFITSKLGKLEQLFIFDCELDDASFIDNLHHLTELTITGSKLKTFRVLKINKNLYSLNLSNNLLQDISFLKLYKNIYILNLSYNQIIDISILTNFKSFTYLALNNNDISDISALNNIEIIELWIGQNKVYDLTPLYNALKIYKIKFLNANENPLIYPPMRVVERGENVILDWFELIIKEVNKKITENLKSQSTTLDLGNLGITDLSLFTELFNLKHLKELIISNEWAEYDNANNRWKRIESSNKVLLKNNISEIPKEIYKLINLEKLIIGGDWKSKNDRIYHKWRIVDISSILILKKLKVINISNNQIENIENIVNLKKIEIIHLNNNRIKIVPELHKLKDLKEIYLSNNLITDIQFLINSNHIETVDLHSNNIVDLRPLENLLRHSNIKIKNSSWEKKCISVSKNSPNINPPYEILNLTKDDFFLYLKQLEYENKLNLPSYYNKEVKVVLVGNSYSGKSTFLNFLKTKRFKKGLLSTHWLVTEELDEMKIGNDNVKLRFFDFGGQDYYHDTHKMFFSSDSLFLLIWDEKSNFLGRVQNERKDNYEEIQVFPLEYWLDSIKIFAKKALSESQKQIEQLLDERDRRVNSKVRYRNRENWVNDLEDSNDSVSKILNEKNILVIQNKVDLGKGFLNQPKLMDSYTNIYDFVNISLLQRIGIKQFYELYEDALKRNLNYKRPLLATWGHIKDNLYEIFKDDNYILDINDFKDRINDNLKIWLDNVFNKSQHEISSMLFKNDEIILFANFLRGIGLVIYNSEHEELKNTIVVNQNKFLESVSEILNLAKENDGKIFVDDLKDIKFHSENIKILIRHNIVFSNSIENNYIAPLFLPDKPNFLIDLLVDVKIPFRKFKFEGFIPKSIILSVFSKITSQDNVSTEDFYFWKNGLVFKNKGGDKVLLKFDIGLDLGFAYIDIFNFDRNSNDLFIKEVVEIVKTIIKSDCSDYKELVTLDGVYFVDVEKLTFNYENDNNHIKAYNYKNNVIKYFNVYKYDKFMDDKLKKPKKKLFISYSKQDEVLVNNFIDHLSSLQGSGLVDTWYCTELSAGEVWDAKIKEKLDEADIVCFMISPKFMSTPYIHKYEVKQTFKRYHRGDEVQIVPIILDFVDWSKKYTFESETGDEVIWSLDRFTALPFTGKAIKRFKNENMAWYVIEQALKIIIEDNVKSEKDEDYIVRKFSPTVRDIYQDIIANNV